jgi:ABC-2 type transport system permease protein
MSSATYTLWLRALKRYYRSKSRMIGSLAQPLFFFLALGFGLGSAISTGGGFSYLKFIGPGVIAMSVLFTSVFSGIQIIWDRQFGFLKETLVAPVSRLSIMLGQTIGGATTAMLQGIFMVIVISIVGLFTPTGIAIGPGILISLLFMILIGIAFTALGVAIASTMEDIQGFQLIVNFLIMPIFFLSGALFPLTNAPTALKIIAYIDPLTYGVEGIRYGLTGVSAINPLICFGAIGGFSVLMIVLGGYLFNKIKV